MAPKKRARPTVRIVSSGLGEETTTTTTTTQASPITSDGWTDEQETTLFKAIAIYRLKPAGMHKHFRIIAIAELMKNHGVSGEHTGIHGIWEKLKTLYNLEALDEMEDEVEAGDDDDEAQDDDGDADDAAKDLPKGWKEFSLPEDEFGDLMRNRRWDPDSRDSPMRTAKEASTVPDDDGDTISGWSCSSHAWLPRSVY